MVDCLSQIQNNFYQVFQYSGRYFYQLGQYQECLQRPNLNYNLVALRTTADQTQIGNLGICLPKQCQTQLIKEFINVIFTQSKMPFLVKNINNDVPSYQYEFNWAFYLTIIISMTTSVLVLYSSLKRTNNKWIQIFSIKQSLKIFKRNQSSNLNVLNGVRSICMIWVVFGHMCFNLVPGAVNLISSLEKNTMETWIFLFVDSAFFSVDTFFFLAGMLLAYVILKENSKSPLKYPLGILQRVLRLWPSYMFTILIYYSIYLHMGSGPNWGSDQDEVRNCSHMWRSIFFLDNLIGNGQHTCMLWGWYLQNDVQIFILSIIIMYLYSIKPIVSYILIFASSLGATIYTYLWTYQHQTTLLIHLTDAAKYFTYFPNVYIKPWARCAPYLIGLFFGIIYFNYLEEKKHFSKKNLDQQKDIKVKTALGRLQKVFTNFPSIRKLCEFIGVAIILFLILILRPLQSDEKWPQWAYSSYHSFAKIFFVIGVYLMILPSLLGFKNSIINFVMDTQLFNFIAKISFCTYLIHVILIQAWAKSRQYTRYVTFGNIFVQFSGILVIALLAGCLMTFMIQIPFSKIQKNIMSLFKNKINSKQSKNQNQIQNQSQYQPINQSVFSNQKTVTNQNK